MWKESYIKQHGLNPFTLCVVDICLMCSTPSLTVNGNVDITAKERKEYCKKV